MKLPGRWAVLRFFLGLCLALMVACGTTGTPDGTTPESEPAALPVLAVPGIQAEVDRIGDLNRTEDFSTPVRPFENTPIGIDARNGEVLAITYICWDICPDIGAYFLVYPGAPSESDCLALSGRPLFAPTPVPGPYMGCRAAVE